MCDRYACVLRRGASCGGAGPGAARRAEDGLGVWGGGRGGQAARLAGYLELPGVLQMDVCVRHACVLGHGADRGGPSPYAVHAFLILHVPCIA